MHRNNALNLGSKFSSLRRRQALDTLNAVAAVGPFDTEAEGEGAQDRTILKDSEVWYLPRAADSADAGLNAARSKRERSEHEGGALTPRRGQVHPLDRRRRTAPEPEQQPEPVPEPGARGGQLTTVEWRVLTVSCAAL